MTLTRRDALLALAQATRQGPRRFHLCLAPDAIDADPELPVIAREAGVSAIWLAGYLYGHWHYSVDRLRRHAERLRALGLEAEVANVPLGHPGDSLGSRDGDVPLTPPKHWRMAVAADGKQFAGTSLHPPAVEENSAALRALAEAGFRRVFLDDDFRLARGPGSIGGCFCPEHVETFLRGRPETREQLLAAVRARSRTPLLRAWTEDVCSRLTAAYRAIQAAAPAVELGLMIMYLGAEKAGIRLPDYANLPIRVGELMFDDRSFAPVKGKTNELFSALFHRRFVKPEQAYSETTAFPANRLSAANLAAKLSVSTLADVRTTMYMSGLTPFPREHWQTLAPAMRKQAALHRRVAGHTPRGPMKHYWGEGSRYLGDDRPYSLFLAMGVPFEVVNRPPADGWTFLADADLDEPAARGISRKQVPETLEALWALKRDVIRTLRDVPYVAEDTPAVCAWYPDARTALVWNLAEEPRELSLRVNGKPRATVRTTALELAAVSW